MIQKIKLIYINLIHYTLRVWWFVIRPEGRGVKVLLKYNNEVCLVRHNYGHGLWTVPGGGVKSGETYEVGAKREIKEELDVTIYNIKNVGSYFSDYQYKKVTVECFVAEVDSKLVKSDDFEIAEVGWFLLTNLPKDKVPSVDRIITFYERSLLREA